MPRKYSSALRKWSQTGGRRGYTAGLLSPKSERPEKIVYLDSLSALAAFLLLEWRQEVVRLLFEGRKFKIPGSDGKFFSYLADFLAELRNGTVRVVEAKDSRARQSDWSRERLALIAMHFARDETPETFELIFRQDIVANWKLPIIQLLRPFGHLALSEAAVDSAEERLRGLPSADLFEWRLRARVHGVKLGVLYHLLYHQRLPLVFGPVYSEDLAICLDWSASN